MYEKFGEFDSAEEINRAAAAQLAEGDTEAIIAIALENGIDKEDAEDYIDGLSDELATPLMASIGKLGLETKELKLGGLLLDWKDAVVQYCMEDSQFCIAVRRKGKQLEACMGALLKYSFENKVPVDERICKAAGLRSPLYLGIPSKTEIKKIIRNYYLG